MIRNGVVGLAMSAGVAMAVAVGAFQVADGALDLAGLLVADLDGDGRLDVAACAERGSNELRWWRNEGPATG